MQTALKLIVDVVAAMTHNYPVLEAIVILPLLLRKYSWVLLACGAVGLLTFGVERHNNYSASNLLSLSSAAFFAVQLTITAVVTALLFALKTRLFRALKISDTGPSKAA